MIPELFRIPFTGITVKSYGVMMVVGFLAAVWLIQRLARSINLDREKITNTALYALISGVVGARLFYVIHHFGEYQDNILGIFAVWNGGLEFVGGFLMAIAVVLIYVYYNKLPLRTYLDLLAIGLMLGLAFGRIGCFLNGCCFGKPCDLPVAVTFPYDSHCYNSQVRPDFSRNRAEPYVDLPTEYFGYVDDNGNWMPAWDENKYQAYLRDFEDLSFEQQKAVREGQYRAEPVYPTQIISSINAFILCGSLYVFWVRLGRYKPGMTFGLMLALYGPTRFLIEFIRDDNPYEYGWWTIGRGLTISQNLGLYLAVFGIIMMVIFSRQKPVLNDEQLENVLSRKDDSDEGNSSG